jgi:hypothetical protein
MGDDQETWKCAKAELQGQIRCFPYVELSHIPRLQQVGKKAVGRQRNLGLAKNKIWYQIISKFISLALARATRAHFHVSWLSDFIFYPKPLYKSPHQSFFYSFITILPSESGVALHYCTILP